MLPTEGKAGNRWITRQTCPPAGAAHVIARAQRIARSLHFAIKGHVKTTRETIRVAAEMPAGAAFAHPPKTWELIPDDPSPVSP